MALDTRYIPAFGLQKELVDKDTGQPLAGGQVTFYKDTARTTKKKIYQITGTPPDYNYIELPNPITLSNVGTFQDGSGNDVMVYYYPYDEDDKVELYFVDVKSSTGVPQFPREGTPNVSAELETADDVKNYVPNGQFLLQNPRVSDEIITEKTEIAPGNWFYQRSAGSTALDFVSFVYHSTWSSNPTGSPRYSCRVKCTSPHLGDTTKELRLEFPDVNKFASDSQKYTYQFEARSLSGPVTLHLITGRFYGLGGSPEVNVNEGSFNTSAEFQKFNVSFTIGNNEGKVIGPNYDDYLVFALILPPDSTFDLEFTNFILTEGEVLISNFPATTDQVFMSNSLFTPPFLGMDRSLFYLPVIQTGRGLEHDSSIVGEIKAFPDNSYRPGYLLCYGQKINTFAYTAEGVPYERLWDKLWDSSLKVPIYGTGSGYMTSFNDGVNPQLIISNNNAGVVAATADGAIPTGFTFETVHTGVASGYEVKAYTHAGSGFYIITDNFGFLRGTPSSPEGPYFLAPNQTASGLPVPAGFSRVFEEYATQDTPQIDKIATPVGSGTLAGTYGVFIINPGSSKQHTVTPGDYGYWWYKVDGVGVDPALVGLTYNVPVNIRSTDTAHEVAEKTRMALNGWHVSRIVTLPASSVTAGSYFLLNTTTQEYYVWFKKDLVGTDPALPAKVGIQVNLLSSDNADLVASRIKEDINKKFFAIPDLRGHFLRGVDNGRGYDPDAVARFSLVPGIFGDRASTIEFSKNKTHSHRVRNNNAGGGSPNATAKVESYFADDRYLNMLEGDRSPDGHPTNTAVYYYIHI
jgi:hypothetical protein